jgi:hypothetical protein
MVETAVQRKSSEKMPPLVSPWPVDPGSAASQASAEVFQTAAAAPILPSRLQYLVIEWQMQSLQ